MTELIYRHLKNESSQHYFYLILLPGIFSTQDQGQFLAAEEDLAAVWASITHTCDIVIYKKYIFGHSDENI